MKEIKEEPKCTNSDHYWEYVVYSSHRIDNIYEFKDECIKCGVVRITRIYYDKEGLGFRQTIDYEVNE